VRPDDPQPAPAESLASRRRRPRYPGTHPRRFAQKYKELDPAAYPDTVARVRASGKTPAGSHIPIILNPRSWGITEIGQTGMALT
jgi:16S rRNA (cytosine1402-N4)-methyltransferase